MTKKNVVTSKFDRTPAVFYSPYKKITNEHKTERNPFQLAPITVYRAYTYTQIYIYSDIHTFFYKKLRSSVSTQSFLAFSDFEYSKFLDSFLTFFSKIEQQAEENSHGFIVENK